jgi:2-octaprenyl-6-methoxyphenol hydroxylase
MNPDYDVLIIGGGLVGASLACALRPSGLKIAVVEAVPFGAPAQPSYDDRTVALALGSQRILHTMGLWSTLETRGVNPIARIHISDRGHLGVARLTAAHAGTAVLGYVVENRVLGAALQQALAAEPAIDLICPASLRALEFADDRVTATLDKAGQHMRLHARLLVAADGTRSTARELAGIAAREVNYAQTAIVSNVTPERAHENTAYERFTDTGPLALLPMSEGRCAVVWSMRPADVEGVLALDDSEFLARLQARFGQRLGRLRQPGKRIAYPLRLLRAREHVRARLAIIGNAAHTVHPVAGQGFNLGLRDVATLAEVLTDAARAGNDIGDLAVLHAYDRWRRRDTSAVSTFTGGMIRVFSNDFAPLAAARGLGLLAVDMLPLVKHALLRRTMGLAGRLPKLARGLPL